MVKNWYVLFVLGQYMEKLKQALNQFSEFEAFVPEKEKIYRKLGKVSKVKVVLFPGYIFVRTEMNQAEFSEKMRELKQERTGIVRELKYGMEDIAALRFEEILFLEKLIDSEYTLRHSIGFIENDRVVITEGPLMGLESSILKIDRHKRTAVIGIPLCKEMREVKVSLEIISKT